MTDTASTVKASGGASYLFFKTIKFIIVSYAISFVLLAVFAALVVYTDVPEGISDIVIVAITLFASFLSALQSAKLVCGKGWLLGLAVGAANVLILLIVGSVCMDTHLFAKANIALVSGGAMSGFLGGILGVNMGNK